MDLQSKLLELGLNKNESAVYIALLKLGLTQAGPVVKAVKLHRMLVYNAMERLENLNLVEVVHTKNIKLFKALDPSSLLDKTKRLNEIANELVPELRSLQAKKDDLVSIRTLIGRDGFINNLIEVIESAGRSKLKTMHIIGGAKDSDFYDVIGDWYKEYVKILGKNKIKKLLLAPENYSNIFKKKFASEKENELKTLPKGLTSPTYTRITEEMVSIEIYHPQVLVIQIRNSAIARGYLDSFNLLWKTAK